MGRLFSAIINSIVKAFTNNEQVTNLYGYYMSK